jgi:HlyD family secretion protein
MGGPFMKKVIFRIVLAAMVAAAAWYGYRFFRQMPQRQHEIPITRVRQSDVVIRSFTRGELRAVRSVTLTAPNLFGTIQVTRLAPLGSFAREKDLVVEFDDSEVRARLEEKQLALEQNDEQIKKSKADLAIRENQDQVEVLRAGYSVRRAQLDVQRNELISAIDAKKNLLSLEEARRRLKQLESDIKSRREQARAELAVLQENRNKAVLDVSREKQRLRQVKLLAPMSGLVAIKQNRTGYFTFGSTVPDIREGDQIYPGTAVADVLDLSEMEIVAKVGEIDRANLHEGQEAVIHLDAIADKQFHGQIKSLSGTASASVFSADPAKKFDVIFSVSMKDLLSALGAKPEQIRKVLETADQNRKKPPMESSNVASIMAVMASPGGMPGAPGPGPAQVRSTLNDTKAGDRGAAPRPRGAGAGGPGMPMPVFAMGSPTQFSEKDLEKAQLPPPPEEDTQLDVLLRPGLLTDIEIIVEKIPNAIHIPSQALFEKDGRLIVYVKSGSRWEERPITLAKRSESTLVIASGLKPGEIVAMSDPSAKKGEKKQDKGGAVGSLPGGGEGGKGGR